MHVIFLTSEVHDTLRREAIRPFREDGIQLPSGDWEVNINDKTFNRLELFRFDGETMSDAVLRLLHYADGKVS